MGGPLPCQAAAPAVAPPPEDELYTELSQMGALSRLDCDASERLPTCRSGCNDLPQKSATGILAVTA